MKKFEILATGAALSSAALLASGCAGEKPAQTVNPVGDVSTEQLLADGAIKVHPGEAKFVPVIVKSSYLDLYTSLKSALPLITHHHRHGASDPNAPKVDIVPQRIDSHVSSGRDLLENDAACDTLNVDVRAGAVGAIALSDETDDRAMLLWPNENGNQGDSVYLCFFEGREPADGTILFETR